MGLAAEDCLVSLGTVIHDWEHVAGASSPCRCFGGLATIFTVRLSASGTAVNLGIEISTLGFCSATLESGVAWHASR